MSRHVRYKLVADIRAQMPKPAQRVPRMALVKVDMEDVDAAADFAVGEIMRGGREGEGVGRGS